MNGEAHSHRISFADTQGYWMIDYGDQHETAGKPTRWFWESDEGYMKRILPIARQRIERLVKKHDRASQYVSVGRIELPDFDDNKWGSEQLAK